MLLKAISSRVSVTSVYLQQVVDASNAFIDRTTSDSRVRKARRYFNKNFKGGSRMRYILFVLLIIGALAGAVRVLGGGSDVLGDDNRISVKDAAAEQHVGRLFSFPLRNSKGEDVSSVAYEITSAEIRDEIVVAGRQASAVKGRTFLILNLKITNEFTRSIEIDTRDYVRLTVNGVEGERLAADIHNDPVEIQAISTKFTRLGFPINDNDRDLVLHVGEINGNKEIVELSISK